jgi:vacuolar-type H+-ATPase subunit H
MAEYHDVIGHLLNIEHQASGLLLDAQVEADQRVSAAKVEADASYKAACDALIAGFEADYDKAMKEIDSRRESILEGYKAELEHMKRDSSQFSRFLDKALFGE